MEGLEEERVDMLFNLTETRPLSLEKNLVLFSGSDHCCKHCKLLIFILIQIVPFLRHGSVFVDGL